MRILVTGLASLQWGRLEFGNNGNYYIFAPLFRQLHRVFPDAEIVTTYQFSDEFINAENIVMLPLSQYYSWRENDGDLKEALQEYAIADIYERTNVLTLTTPFIQTLLQTDLLVTLSGDMWGDNRDSTNANRFLVELLKDSTAQKLAVPTVLFASSPGPIDDMDMRKIAKEVYERFDKVINRDTVSDKLFESYGFDISNTITRACPSILFGKEYYPEAVDLAALKRKEGLPGNEKLIGFIVTTNSLPGGSFSDWERSEEDFIYLAQLVEYITNESEEVVVLFSHSDGFVLEPEFKRVHWRDYKMVCMLYDLLDKRGIAEMNNVFRIDGIYPPWVAHCFIGSLDKLISGKLHGSIAGMEQFIPTLMIDYQNGPVSHKFQGMTEFLGMTEHIVPRGCNDLIPHYRKLSQNRDAISEKLRKTVPKVQEKILDAFNMLPQYVKESK